MANVDIDKLSYEIFSILESNFLNRRNPSSSPSSKIRILSIDAASDGGILAALTLSRLETLLRKHSGNPSACIADFFDLASGSGSGGLLASLLFSPGPDSRPLLSAHDSLRLLLLLNSNKRNGIFRRIFRSGNDGISQKLKRIFGELTLKDSIKPVLISCYDVLTSSAFTFSRSDAVESDGYDFLIRDACAATCTAEEMDAISVDGRRKVRAVGGGVGIGNPTAAAITHVLNNKREFPGAQGVENLLVVSLGSAGPGRRAGGCGGGGGGYHYRRKFANMIAGETAVDQVDQSVAMAFGDSCSTNYVRIQGSGMMKGDEDGDLVSAAEAVLSQRNVESVMFRGKKVSDATNGEKVEWVSGELIKEQDRRQRSEVPMAFIKPVMVVATPRTSSETTVTSVTVASSGTSASSLC